MTVGIAAIADGDTSEPKVIVSADRLLTTQQQSAIEHEHPEAKISSLAPDLPDAELLTVFAGSIALAEELKESIEEAVWQLKDKQKDGSISVKTLAELSAAHFRHLVQQKIENVVLSTYGLELDDLSKQHQFKDSFFNDIWAEASNVEKRINQNLVMLLGGVDDLGGHIYRVGNNDVTAHNEMGYATIGSGTQPAESEFIKSGHGKKEGFTTALATVTAANHQAQQASGVGGDLDICVVNRGKTKSVDDATAEALIKRQERIAEEQESVKRDILRSETVEWRINDDV